MMAYRIESPGKIGKGKVFCTVTQPNGRRGISGGDGATIDIKGNVYITTAIGVQVFNSHGKQLGVIKFPEQPANVTFGGPEGKTLYVTARTSVYTCLMSVRGHVFGRHSP